MGWPVWLFSKTRVESQLDKELRFHLDQRAADLIASGVAPDEARRRARLEFGGVEEIKEECRESRTGHFLETLAQDARYGLRMLRKSPGFTAVAVLTLALGIGANTAIFSLVDAVMLKMLPVKDPSQLVLLQWRGPWPPHSSQTGDGESLSFSYPAFEGFRRENKVLSSVFAFVPLGFSDENTTVTIHGEPRLANGWMVTGDFFAGLGVKPVLGRLLTEQDEDKGAPRAAVISYDYWTRQFARDPAIIGKSVALNGLPFTIIGVTPRAFYGVALGERPDLWVAFDDLPALRPWSMPPYGSTSVFTANGWMCLNVMGRLQPGVSKQQAQAALNVVWQQFVTAELKPAQNAKLPTLGLVAAAQGLDYLRQAETQPLYVLMCLVGIVLLIACASLATLLLARATARRREISIRLATGASRWRLIRQLLTESLMMAIAGGALGLLLANWGTHALLSLLSQGGTGMTLDANADSTVFLFTLGVCVVTGFLFGIAPAILASRVDLAAAMKEGGAGAGRGREGHTLGKSLVVVQVAASLMLMIGAGLFARTLIGLEHQNFGFNQQNLLLFGLDASRAGYKGEQAAQFYDRVLDRIGVLPGVLAATMNQNRPFSGWSNNTNISVEGSPAKDKYPTLRWDMVGPGFFQTMQIPIVQGRGITRADTAASPKVAVVDETFVRKYLPHVNPIGRHFSFEGDADMKDQFEIVGVAKNAELNDVHGYKDAKAYMPYAQWAQFASVGTFEVRCAGNTAAILGEVRGAVRQMDSMLPLSDVKTQAEQIDDALVQERLFARISGFFGLLALLLASIGLYGTLAYAVTRKTHDIGIRMALGAQRGVVIRMVLRQGLLLVAIGLAIGVGGAIGLTRYIASELYGVTATDPATFAAVVLLLALVALIACWIPARRAMRVDPMVALRHE